MPTHVAIIGAYGSAGVAVADDLVDKQDLELTLIDDGEPGGGLCILRGCMPSKEVLSAGAHRFQGRDDHRLTGPVPDIDLEQVVETKNSHINDFAAHRRAAVHKLAEHDHVEFMHDTARFVDSRVIEVGEEQLHPDYIVIATGSRVNIPELPGIEAGSYLTSEDVLDRTDFPDSGIVMGFGYVGLELVPYLAEAAQMDLTVIEHNDHPIDEADAVFGEEILELYREKFDIDIRTNTHEQRVESMGDAGVKLVVDNDGTDEVLEADTLFLFTGRRPNLDGLGLENTDLSPGEDWVKPTMQTRQDPRTFVVGDANGHEPILHVAKEQGFLVAENIDRHRQGDEVQPYENIHHHVIFSGLGIYPYVRVGHSEESAQNAERDYLSVSRRASDDGVFKTKDVPEGVAKLIVDETNGTVLGYQGLHYHADVMAKTMQIAVEQELDVRDIPDRSYHPTTPEILDGLFRAASRQLEN